MTGSGHSAQSPAAGDAASAGLGGVARGAGATGEVGHLPWLLHSDTPDRRVSEEGGQDLAPTPPLPLERLAEKMTGVERDRLLQDAEAYAAPDVAHSSAGASVTFDDLPDVLGHAHSSNHGGYGEATHVTFDPHPIPYAAASPSRHLPSQPVFPYTPLAPSAAAPSVHIPDPSTSPVTPARSDHSSSSQGSAIPAVQLYPFSPANNAYSPTSTTSQGTYNSIATTVNLGPELPSPSTHSTGQAQGPPPTPPFANSGHSTGGHSPQYGRRSTMASSTPGASATMTDMVQSAFDGSHFSSTYNAVLGASISGGSTVELGTLPSTLGEEAQAAFAQVAAMAHDL